MVKLSYCTSDGNGREVSISEALRLRDRNEHFTGICPVCLKKVRPHAAGKDGGGKLQAAHFEHFPGTRPQSGTLERREWDRKHHEFNNAKRP